MADSTSLTRWIGGRAAPRERRVGHRRGHLRAGAASRADRAALPAQSHRLPPTSCGARAASSSSTPAPPPRARRAALAIVRARIAELGLPRAEVADRCQALRPLAPRGWEAQISRMLGPEQAPRQDLGKLAASTLVVVLTALGLVEIRAPEENRPTCDPWPLTAC